MGPTAAQNGMIGSRALGQTSLRMFEVGGFEGGRVAVLPW
jgi:hypothetical protein